MKSKTIIGGATTAKKIENILDKMIDVDNTKVDTIRRLYFALQTDNYDSLLLFLKEKEVVKTKKIVTPKSKQIWML